MIRSAVLVVVVALLEASALAGQATCFNYTAAPVTCHIGDYSCTAPPRDPNNRFSENFCHIKEIPAGTYRAYTDAFPDGDTINIRADPYASDYCDVHNDFMKCTKYEDNK